MGCLLIAYKFGLAFMGLIGIGLFLSGGVLPGLVLFIFSVLLFGSQTRREHRRREDQKHREILAAMQANQQK